jgi:hypothetical protein
MSDPERLKNESDSYGKALEGQLKKQSEAVIEEAKIKKAMLEEQAKREVAAFQLHVEEKIKMAQIAVDKEAQRQLMGLQEAAIIRKTTMEEEAALKAAGYTKAKAMEEMANKSKNVNKQFREAERKLAEEYQTVMRAGARAVATPAMPAVPGVTVPEMVQYAPPAFAAPGYAAPQMAVPQQMMYAPGMPTLI